jgi:hypothetical protein
VNRSAGLNETNERPVLGSELPPALEAATLDHRAPGTGPHTVAEAVLALTASHIGLIGTLHGEVSPIGRSRCNRKDSGRLNSMSVAALPAAGRGEREVQRRSAKSLHRSRNIAATVAGANRALNCGLPFLPNSHRPWCERISPNQARSDRGLPPRFPLLPVDGARPYTCRRSRTDIGTSPDNGSGNRTVANAGRARNAQVFRTVWIDVWMRY